MTQVEEFSNKNSTENYSVMFRQIYIISNILNYKLIPLKIIKNN